MCRDGLSMTSAARRSETSSAPALRYRRYAITDSAMLQEASVKLAVLHASEANSPSTAKVKELSGNG